MVGIFSRKLAENSFYPSVKYFEGPISSMIVSCSIDRQSSRVGVHNHSAETKA